MPRRSAAELEAVRPGSVQCAFHTEPPRVPVPVPVYYRVAQVGKGAAAPVDPSTYLAVIGAHHRASLTRVEVSDSLLARKAVSTASASDDQAARIAALLWRTLNERHDFLLDDEDDQ